MRVRFRWRKSARSRSEGLLRWASAAFFLLGLAMIGFSAAAYFHAELYQAYSGWRFQNKLNIVQARDRVGHGVQERRENAAEKQYLPHHYPWTMAQGEMVPRPRQEVCEPFTITAQSERSIGILLLNDLFLPRCSL